MKIAAREKKQLLISLLFLLGWLHNGWTLYDIGDRSITLMFLSAIPFLFYLKFPGKLLLFVCLQLASGILSVMVAIALGQERAISNLGQQLLGMVVMIGAAAFDWETLLPAFRKLMLWIAVPICVYGVYQLAARARHLPYAFLPMSNLQQEGVNGFQRTYGDRFHIRASSVFIEPSDFGYFCCWLVCLGMGTNNMALRAIFLILAFVGILVAQSLGATICLVLLLLVYAIRMRKIGIIFSAAATAAVAMFLATFLFPTLTEKFFTRVDKAAQLDSSADSDRISRVPQNTSVILDAPLLGHGLASWRTFSPAGVANGFFDLLEERGIVGTAMFLVPYFVILFDCWRKRASDRNELEATRLLFAVLNLYTFLTFAMLYFFPFWFAMGMTYTDRKRSRRNRRPQLPAYVLDRTPAPVVGA
jgi:O-antigen ligase